MIELLPEQVEAVRQLNHACQDAGVDAVIIGATAYRVWIDDDRRTQDVDVALAVDIDQFGSVTEGLQAAGWTQDPRREERWVTRAAHASICCRLESRRGGRAIRPGRRLR